MKAHGALDVNFGTKTIFSEDRRQDRKKETLEKNSVAIRGKIEKKESGIALQGDKAGESKEKGHGKRLCQRESKLAELRGELDGLNEKANRFLFRENDGAVWFGGRRAGGLQPGNSGLVPGLSTPAPFEPVRGSTRHFPASMRIRVRRSDEKARKLVGWTPCKIVAPSISREVGLATTSGHRPPHP